VGLQKFWHLGPKRPKACKNRFGGRAGRPLPLHPPTPSLGIPPAAHRCSEEEGRAAVAGEGAAERAGLATPSPGSSSTLAWPPGSASSGCYQRVWWRRGAGVGPDATPTREAAIGSGEGATVLGRVARPPFHVGEGHGVVGVPCAHQEGAAGRSGGACTSAEEASSAWSGAFRARPRRHLGWEAARREGGGVAAAARTREGAGRGRSRRDREELGAPHRGHRAGGAEEGAAMGGKGGRRPIRLGLFGRSGSEMREMREMREKTGKMD